MREAAALQQFVTALFSRHTIPAGELEAHLRLGEDEYLVVSQTPKRRQVRLSRVMVYNTVTRLELEIMFFVDGTGRWIPYEYFRPATGRQVCGVVNPREETLVLNNQLLQRGLVVQCDLWAMRLNNEGWLEHSIKVDVSGLAADGLMLWPIPTVEAPTDDQLEVWLVDAEPCKATDGCPCDLDGTCPHEYPSWLRYLGLV